MTTSKATRSEIMRAVRSKDTGPEMIVRKLVHGMGYRYRLHQKDLPGNPDLVFPKRRKIIFVHGCFWHHHDCKRGDRKPIKNSEYWTSKIARNVERDRASINALRNYGWAVLVVWECETLLRDRAVLASSLNAFLD